MALLALEVPMAALTIRNIDETLKSELRRQAAANDRSMEEEARTILRKALSKPTPPERGLGTVIRKLVEEHGGGIDLDLPPRGPARPLPDVFDE
jgi:plasmid stability protein